MRTFTWTFHSAGQLVFGRNAAAKLGDVARRLGARRVFIVTDPVLLKAGLVDPVHAPLSEAGLVVEVFSGGEPEPSLRAEEAVAAARVFRPDAVVGLGGGSNMDLATISAVILAHGGRPARLRRRRQGSRPDHAASLCAHYSGDRCGNVSRSRPLGHRQSNEGRRP